MDKKVNDAKASALRAIKGSQTKALNQEEKAERDRVLGAKFEMFRHLKELSVAQGEKNVTGLELAKQTNEIMEVFGL